MALRMEFLGTGTSQGVPVVACTCAVCASEDLHDKRLRTSVWLSTGNTDILIDAGPDLRQQALRSRIPKLDAVLITHEHMDHVAGIDELRAYNFAQQRSMDLHGQPRALDAIRSTFHYAFSEHKYPGVPELDLIPVGDGPFRVNEVEIVPVQVMHDRLPILGYRMGALAYITDAKTIAQGEREKLKDLQVLVVNALRIKPHHSHFNLDEALQLVADLRPQRTFFTHISHLLGKHRDVEQHLPKGVGLAHDGLVVSID